MAHAYVVSLKLAFVCVFVCGRSYLLRASSWETGADLEMKIGRFLLKIGTQSRYVDLCNMPKFSFNDLY